MDRLANLFRTDDRQFQARLADAAAVLCPSLLAVRPHAKRKTSIIISHQGDDAEVCSDFACAPFSREFCSTAKLRLTFLDTRA